MSAPHMLLVTFDPCALCPAGGRCADCQADPHFKKALLCPGPGDNCRAYQECPDCPESWVYDSLDDGDPVAHGAEHYWLQGCWMVPTAVCLAQEHDSVSDAADELRLGEGTWPVDVRFEEEGEVLVLDLREARAVAS